MIRPSCCHLFRSLCQRFHHNKSATDVVSRLARWLIYNCSISLKSSHLFISPSSAALYSPFWISPSIMFSILFQEKEKSRILFTIACFVTKNHAHAIMSHILRDSQVLPIFVFYVNRMERRISSVVWKTQSDTWCSSLNKFAECWANQNVMKDYTTRRFDCIIIYLISAMK